MSAPSPPLDAADLHHLERVLRLRDGEPVVACDGAGSWRPCRWRSCPGGSAIEAGSSGLVADGDVRVEAEPPWEVWIGFVPTKGDRPEWVVQKCTELGADRIVVASSSRSVVRWEGDRAERHLAKLAEVARQAGAQSRRTRLPVVEGVVPLASLAGAAGWLLAVPGGPPVSLPAVGAGVGAAGTARSAGGAGPPVRCAGVEPLVDLGRQVGDQARVGDQALGGDQVVAGVGVRVGVGVLVGPEGGWSPTEETASGLPPVGLGAMILRAETAAVAAVALLGGLRSGAVGPA